MTSARRKFAHFAKPAIPRFQAAFLGPRFWATWGLMLILRITMHLPRRWVMAAGGALGDHLRRRNHKRRRIAEINLAMCFPERSAARRQRMLRSHFRQHGRGLLDMGLALWASQARIDRLCRLCHAQRLREVPPQTPIIILAYHLTTLDISGRILAGRRDFVSMMKRDRNPLLNWLLWRGRSKKVQLKMVMRDQGLRPLLRRMKAGDSCMFIPDEDFGQKKRAVFTPFFGVQTSTLTVVARLAQLSGARVMPCAAFLEPRTGHYEMILGQPLQNFPSADPGADAAAINRAMETLIRHAPEHYMWTFRWFKTRPDGQPNPYKSRAGRHHP